MIRKITTIAISLFISLRPCYGAIAVNSQETSNAGHKSVTSPLTWSFTNTAGTKIICGFVVTDTSGGVAVVMSTPTYNGVQMTNVGTQTNFTGGADLAHNIMAIYYLDSPATGANTVSLAYTASSSPDGLGGCISFTGMNTGSGVVTTGTGTTGTTATAGNITTASGNYIFATGGWGSGAGGVAGTGFTLTYLLNGSGLTAGDDILGEYKASTGGATTPTFTFTGSDNWGIMAAEFTASGGGAAVTGFSKMSRIALMED